MADLLDRINTNPAVCGGKPCIRGTGIWVSLVLDLLAGGTSEAELRADYPQLAHKTCWRPSPTRRIAFDDEAARPMKKSYPRSQNRPYIVRHPCWLTGRCHDAIRKPGRGRAADNAVRGGAPGGAAVRWRGFASLEITARARLGAGLANPPP
jgi:uncharacterized protein (DUF433 family)